MRCFQALIVLSFLTTILMSCKKSEPTAARLLTKQDLGKVFTILGQQQNESFGKYKILMSDATPGFYSFYSFDLIDGEPAAKLLVTHEAKPVFTEVVMEEYLVTRAQNACKIKMKQEGSKINSRLKKRRLTSSELKEKFSVKSTYALLKTEKLEKFGLDYAVWINPSASEFRIHLYSDDEMLSEEKLAWSADPVFGMSPEDQQKVYGNDGIIAKMIQKAYQ